VSPSPALSSVQGKGLGEALPSRAVAPQRRPVSPYGPVANAFPGARNLSPFRLQGVVERCRFL